MVSRHVDLTIPVAGSEPIFIKGTFPISAADWAQMMAVLEAMKPGLVVDDPVPVDF